jgi:hypothetical protein
VLAETTANNGITQLLLAPAAQGHARRTAERSPRRLNPSAASIDSYGGNNSFGVNVEVLSSDFADRAWICWRMFC